MSEHHIKSADGSSSDSYDGFECLASSDELIDAWLDTAGAVNTRLAANIVAAATDARDRRELDASKELEMGHEAAALALRVGACHRRRALERLAAFCKNTRTMLLDCSDRCVAGHGSSLDTAAIFFADRAQEQIPTGLGNADGILSDEQVEVLVKLRLDLTGLMTLSALHQMMAGVAAVIGEYVKENKQTRIPANIVAVGALNDAWMAFQSSSDWRASTETREQTERLHDRVHAYLSPHKREQLICAEALVLLKLSESEGEAAIWSTVSDWWLMRDALYDHQGRAMRQDVDSARSEGYGSGQDDLA